MKKIKFLSLLIIALVLAISLCSCDENGAELEERTLNVYNWGEYISDENDPECGLVDVNSKFEEYFNSQLAEKYGYKIKVNYSTYATNEDMYSKITNSAVAYDVVIPSDYMIQKMIENDKLQPLNFDIITNYVNISDEFKNLPYDPENKYSVPYTFGMLAIIYNEKFVDEEDVANQSWELLWDEKYSGKILQFNNPRDAFATAMYWKNLDINSHDPEVWNQALDLLKEQKPLLQGYVNDEIFNKMKGESAWIAPYFAGDFLTMAAENESLKHYYPKEGTNYFVDAMCIPKNSKNVDAANEYINFMLREEIGTANSLYIGYASPNTKVKDSKYYQEMLAENYGESAYDTLYGTSAEDANKLYNYPPAYENFYEDEDVDIQSHVNSLWEKLKTENSTEPWIHVTSITIVVGVIALASYNIYIKKKRSRDYRMRDRLKQNKK